jgi:hypothetical protein
VAGQRVADPLRPAVSGLEQGEPRPDLDTFVLTATGDHPPVIPEVDDP